MNFQVIFLSPIISGIVVGLTALITLVLSGLAGKLADINQLAGASSDVPVASLGFMIGIFQMSQGTSMVLVRSVQILADMVTENYGDKLSSDIVIAEEFSEMDLLIHTAFPFLKRR